MTQERHPETKKTGEGFWSSLLHVLSSLAHEVLIAPVAKEIETASRVLREQTDPTDTETNVLPRPFPGTLQKKHPPSKKLSETQQKAHAALARFIGKRHSGGHVLQGMGSRDGIKAALKLLELDDDDDDNEEKVPFLKGVLRYRLTLTKDRQATQAALGNVALKNIDRVGVLADRANTLEETHALNEDMLIQQIVSLSSSSSEANYNALVEPVVAEQ